jgi:tRNA pseudouridine55 synthase
VARRRKGDPVDGVVLLDKPAGLSSNQALQRVRRLFNARKGGHTGTLDPFATGLLPLCFGEASKTTAFLLDARKTYRAVARFGAATATGDPEGEVVTEGPVPDLDPAAMAALLERFTGDIEQVPPMYSALKVDGKPLYELARQGITVPRKPRAVTIHRLEAIDWTPPDLTFDVECSKGTYIRTLAEDLATALDSVAHLVSLRRLQVGAFSGEHMVTLEALEAAAEQGTLFEHLLPVDAGLPHWPVVTLDGPGARAFQNGNPAPIRSDSAPESGVWVRAYGPDQVPLGLGQADAGHVHPRKVFVAGKTV